MKIIAFAHTTAALLAGVKTVTRRDWTADYAAKFQEGEIVQAWDRSPRVHGRRLGLIQLTSAPTFEPLTAMPTSDYADEGFEWMHRHPETLPKTVWGKPFHSYMVGHPWFHEAQQSDHRMWVIRYELIDVFQPGFEAQPDEWRQAILADHAPAVDHFYTETWDQLGRVHFGSNGAVRL